MIVQYIKLYCIHMCIYVYIPGDAEAAGQEDDGEKDGRHGAPEAAPGGQGRYIMLCYTILYYTML